MILRKEIPSSFERLVRFIPKSDASTILVGQPVDGQIDVGKAIFEGQQVWVQVYSGTSVLAPGSPIGTQEEIDRLLSPVTAEEVGSIRCIGLNYKQHAAEVNLAIPTIPTLFMKPSTALASPWPQPTILPKLTQLDNCGDYEAELAVVIGKAAKNVSEEDAMSHVLGFTAANDVSSRTSQFAQSQWCFSKGFDASCPIGPTLVSPSLVPDVTKLRIRGVRNGEILQDCDLDDLIFSIPKLISFLSQGTTLQSGTLILTGTPAGVGISRKPPVSLNQGDVFSVEILPHIGSLITKCENEA